MGMDIPINLIIFCQTRNHIPVHIKGGSIPSGDRFDFTENVDIFRTITKMRPQPRASFE